MYKYCNYNRQRLTYPKTHCFCPQDCRNWHCRSMGWWKLPRPPQLQSQWQTVGRIDLQQERNLWKGVSRKFRLIEEMLNAGANSWLKIIGQNLWRRFSALNLSCLSEVEPRLVHLRPSQVRCQTWRASKFGHRSDNEAMQHALQFVALLFYPFAAKFVWLEVEEQVTLSADEEDANLPQALLLLVLWFFVWLQPPSARNLH